MSYRAYPASLVAEARRLHGTGWSPSEIHRLGLLDPLPSASTIRTWVDPTYKEIHLRSTRRSQARQRARNLRMLRRDSTPEAKFARVIALRDAGMGARNIARVLTLDLGERITEHQVDRVLENAQWSRPWRRQGAAA